MYSCDLKQVLKENPEMNWIHSDKNGFVYLSQYEPRYWGWTEKSGRFMACNLKVLYKVHYFGHWQDSVTKLRTDIDKKYFLPKK